MIGGMGSFNDLVLPDNEADKKLKNLRKELFEYIDSLKENTFEKSAIENSTASDFENEVARHLSEKNYTVKQKWRVGSYDIDMVAIYDDKKIAIENFFNVGSHRIKFTVEEVE